MARTLLRIPATAARGEVVEIRTLIQHPMETGYRPGADGTVQPRDIIRRFTCHYNNRLVFEAALHPAIAANPFLSFTITAAESGILVFTWEGDNGFAQTETRALEVV
ncbi:thiosulfate oxidation carrier complex protein SoxZ [Siccirubricoccus deserti]|uniref:Thiosulfate oxidation carrier complex protein SoxZ n=1 Tax=Siccirubricoccus deserti TaxID=2013562 RepID=A0A9X0R0Q2_9PROT|nr:thiosulfate oxidation carrier complex protein SoxZ [Siccirubricoccus deserti]MBC4017401.1 thiosulfate oxidation carrier complex protein SoxZ [Siccirubricoccus deserti]GGC58883.1 thiosulfate oxidation carrier complex protein SoxZ [Siccirubricoccus deserti]